MSSCSWSQAPLPILTGALADRYGFRKTFITDYLVMFVSYYMLGQFTTLPTFFIAFMFVAIGAALQLEPVNHGRGVRFDVALRAMSPVPLSRENVLHTIAIHVDQVKGV